MRGAIRLSAPPTYARTRIAPLLPGFLETYPGPAPRDGPHRRRAPTSSASRSTSSSGWGRCRTRPSRAACCRASSSSSAPRPATSRRHGAPATVAELATRKCLVTETFGLRSRWVFLGRAPAGGRRARLPGQRRPGDAARGGAPRPRHRRAAVVPGRRRPARRHPRAGPAARASARASRAHAVLPSGRHVPRRVRAFVDFLAARLRGGARPGYGHRRSDRRTVRTR